MKDELQDTDRYEPIRILLTVTLTKVDVVVLVTVEVGTLRQEHAFEIIEDARPARYDGVGKTTAAWCVVVGFREALLSST